MKTKNEFYLVTVKEKSEVHDSQIYNRIIRDELNKKNSGNRIISERGEQLMRYRDKINADKKALRIKLRSEALNIIEDKRRALAKQYLDQKEMVGVKLLNMDDSIAKKYSKLFDIPTEEHGTGTSNGMRISYNTKRTYISFYITIRVSLWRNHVSHDESISFWIYTFEDDKMTIKELANFTEGEHVSLARENRNAKKYMEYLKKSEKKLEELRKACHPYMLETIKNNQ